MSFSERRKYPRVHEAVSCQVSLGAGQFRTVTKNLSCGGTLCSLAEEVPPMTKLELVLDLPAVHGSSTPGRQIVHCVGVVVRQDRLPLEEHAFLTAIYFSDLKPEDRRRIGEFILQSMFSHDRRRS